MLPSPRLVSSVVATDLNRPDNIGTLLIMQFGQLIDHELANTPMFRLIASGKGITCCSDGKFLSPSLVHKQCLPIEIPPEDGFYSNFGHECMNFVRSMLALSGDCRLGYAEQMDQVTHFVDGSSIYGSDDDEAEELRTFVGGRLKTTNRAEFQELDLLPTEEGMNECSVINPDLSESDRQCFTSGDKRSSETFLLAAVHTVFLREHNRIADDLSGLNPHWDDEILYQESRRIVVAEFQHIIYNEWLPLILGIDLMMEWNMLPLESGYSDDYSDQVNPSIFNEFATAAFRFGHTLIQGNIS